MTDERQARLDEARSRFAKNMAVASNWPDPRLEEAFRTVPREAFLPPGPWHITSGHGYVETPDDDPVHLYQDVLVAIDRARGINNGEPILHAAWIGAVAPQAGETVCHIGAGLGYYTAILALLVQPDGRVHAFEIEEDLAHGARENLKSFDNVTVIQGDASRLPLPSSDLIYVNAGIRVPPLSWLAALRPGGRLIFPWQPLGHVGPAIVLTRLDQGFMVIPLMMVSFIPCAGVTGPAGCEKVPDLDEVWLARSAWLPSDRPPDETAVAVYDHLWFSSREADGKQFP